MIPWSLNRVIRATLGRFSHRSSLWCSTTSTRNCPRIKDIKLLQKKKILAVAYNNGEEFRLPYEYLRVFSPSADTYPDMTKDVASARVLANRANVDVIKVEVIGNYAIRLVFDDMHDTGIYSWDFLYELGQNKLHRMRVCDVPTWQILRWWRVPT